jgi:hypothetical protein
VILLALMAVIMAKVGQLDDEDERDPFFKKCASYDLPSVRPPLC